MNDSSYKEPVEIAIKYMQRNIPLLYSYRGGYPVVLMALHARIANNIHFPLPSFPTLPSLFTHTIPWLHLLQLVTVLIPEALTMTVLCFSYSDDCSVLCYVLLLVLCVGPRAIGVFHEALNATHHLHLFNYLAQLFTQAGIQLPPSRQMKGEERRKGGREEGKGKRREDNKLGQRYHIFTSSIFIKHTP